MQWLNIFYCFINYHFGFIYFLKIANWRQKGKYKNNSAIFLSPKMLQPIILETTLNFIFGLQLSSKWSPNGLLFTSKVVSIWSPMETFSSLPISSQPCGPNCSQSWYFGPVCRRKSGKRTFLPKWSVFGLFLPPKVLFHTLNMHV